MPFERVPFSKRLAKEAALERQELYAKLYRILLYLRIRRKSKESKEIDPPPPGRGNSPKSGDDRIDQVFCLRHRGFERV